MSNVMQMIKELYNTICSSGRLECMARRARLNTSISKEEFAELYRVETKFKEIKKDLMQIKKELRNFVED